MEVFVRKNSLDTLPIFEFENQLYSLNDHVSDHTWITKPLKFFMQTQNYNNLYITHIGKVYELFPEVVGVSPNLLKLGFN